MLVLRFSTQSLQSMRSRVSVDGTDRTNHRRTLQFNDLFGLWVGYLKSRSTLLPSCDYDISRRLQKVSLQYSGSTSLHLMDEQI